MSHSQLSPFAVVSDRVGTVPLAIGPRRAQAVFAASRVSHHMYCSQRLRLMLFTVCSHSYEEEVWHSGCRETMAWGHQVFWHTVYNIIRNQIRVFVIRIVCFKVDVVGDDWCLLVLTKIKHVTVHIRLKVFIESDRISHDAQSWHKQDKETRAKQGYLPAEAIKDVSGK